MKSYTSSKKFLPKAYVEKRIKDKNNSLKRTGIYLIIMNLILLPINYNMVTDRLNSKSIVVSNFDEDYTNRNLNYIYEWLDLDKSLYSTLEVENNTGKITSINENGIYGVHGSRYKIMEIKKLSKGISAEIILGE